MKNNYIVNFKLLDHGRTIVNQIPVTASSKEDAVAVARGLLAKKHPGSWLDYAFC